MTSIPPACSAVSGRYAAQSQGSRQHSGDRRRGREKTRMADLATAFGSPGNPALIAGGSGKTRLNGEFESNTQAIDAGAGSTAPSRATIRPSNSTSLRRGVCGDSFRDAAGQDREEGGGAADRDAVIGDAECLGAGGADQIEAGRDWLVAAEIALPADDRGAL